MCNLYHMRKSAAEVSRMFDLELVAGGGNAGEEIYPGHPGLVIANGQLRTMHWGFPLALHGKHGQLLKPRPVNNARSDKLTGPFWRASFTQRRCLIPLTAYAEAEGEAGRKTRSWLSMPGGEIFTAAGLWRSSDEWGDVYAMVVTDAAGTAAQVHDRMPVLIAPQDRESYLRAESSEALALCRPYAGELLLDRTDQLWAGGRRSAPDGSAHS